MDCFITENRALSEYSWSFDMLCSPDFNRVSLTFTVPSFVFEEKEVNVDLVCVGILLGTVLQTIVSKTPFLSFYCNLVLDEETKNHMEDVLLIKLHVPTRAANGDSCREGHKGNKENVCVAMQQNASSEINFKDVLTRREESDLFCLRPPMLPMCVPRNQRIVANISLHPASIYKTMREEFLHTLDITCNARATLFFYNVTPDHYFHVFEQSEEFWFVSAFFSRHNRRIKNVLFEKGKYCISSNIDMLSKILIAKSLE